MILVSTVFAIKKWNLEGGSVGYKVSKTKHTNQPTNKTEEWGSVTTGHQVRQLPFPPFYFKEKATNLNS